MDDLVDNFFTIFTAGMKTKLNVPLCCLFVFVKYSHHHRAHFEYTVLEI